MDEQRVLIVGGGVAGLTCALELERLGLQCLILEKSDAVGGRMRTDLTEDGFRLDRGFHVFQPAYSECKRLLDEPALKLRHFHAGAIIQRDDGAFKVGDPSQEPSQLMTTLASPVGCFADKLKVLKLKSDVTAKTYEQLMQEPPLSALSFLRKCSFSEEFLADFWRPFFSGIFLDEHLESHAGFLRYLIKVFAAERAAVPEQGIGEITLQLANQLRSTEIRFHQNVKNITDQKVQFENGNTLKGAAVVCATDGPEAAKLLKIESIAPANRSVTTFYFATSESPIHGPWLVVNSYRQARYQNQDSRVVNHLAVMSEVSSAYAPAGQSLVSCSVLGFHPEMPPETVLADLRNSLGKQVNSWRFLRRYPIAHAHPALRSEFRRHQIRTDDGIFLCGDHTETPCVQGAMLSGKRVAEQIISVLKRDS